MIAELTIRVELDQDEIEDGPNAAAQEIAENSSDFMSQYGPVLDVRVRLFDGESVTADTGSPSEPAIPEKPKRKRATKAVKADSEEDRDDRFLIADLPAELPKPVVPKRGRVLPVKGVPR